MMLIFCLLQIQCPLFADDLLPIISSVLLIVSLHFVVFFLAILLTRHSICYLLICDVGVNILHIVLLVAMPSSSDVPYSSVGCHAK
jgi:hypothetical protein